MQDGMNFLCFYFQFSWYANCDTECQNQKEPEDRKMTLGTSGYPPSSPSLNLELPQEGQMFIHPSCRQIEPFACSSSSLQYPTDMVVNICDLIVDLPASMTHSQMNSRMAEIHAVCASQTYLESTVFWDIMPRSPLKVDRCFERTCYVHLHGSKNRPSEIPMWKQVATQVILGWLSMDYMVVYHRR
jgi:hypothetical protein